MPVYQWVGKNRKDEVQKGEVEAVMEPMDGVVEDDNTIDNVEIFINGALIKKLSG